MLLISICLVLAVLGSAFFIDKVIPGLMAEALPKADRVHIAKTERILTLYRGKEVIKTYPIQLGGNPVGHKQFEGDQRTPEGDYEIDWRNPRSRFHLSLHISYPNADDKRHAREQGRDPGGDIMIHGVPNGLGALSWFFSGRDWTDGCVAVSNVSMAEIWSAVDDGTPVQIEN